MEEWMTVTQLSSEAAILRIGVLEQEAASRDDVLRNLSAENNQYDAKVEHELNKFNGRLDRYRQDQRKNRTLIDANTEEIDVLSVLKGDVTFLEARVESMSDKLCRCGKEEVEEEGFEYASDGEEPIPPSSTDSSYLTPPTEHTTNQPYLIPIEDVVVETDGVLDEQPVHVIPMITHEVVEETPQVSSED
jgi:hypothetical protein